MSTMIFKHNDGYNNFILSHPTAKLLYSLQIPTTVYSKLTKKTNKRKTKADDLYIDVKEQVIDRLTNNYGYKIHDTNRFICRISIKFDYEQDTYIEQSYTVELNAYTVDDYSTLPTYVLENLSIIELYMHVNELNKSLKNEIEELTRSFRNSGAYNSSHEY